MKKYILFFMPLILLAALPSTSLYPQKDDNRTQLRAPHDEWSKLGERSVSARSENDVLPLEAGSVPAREIKLRVNRGGLNLHKCLVRFADGEKLSIDLRNDIPPGGESRVIPLGDKARVIVAFEFWYDTRNYVTEQAQLELWARS